MRRRPSHLMVAILDFIFILSKGDRQLHTHLDIIIGVSINIKKITATKQGLSYVLIIIVNCKYTKINISHIRQ